MEECIDKYDILIYDQIANTTISKIYKIWIKTIFQIQIKKHDLKSIIYQSDIQIIKIGLIINEIYVSNNSILEMEEWIVKYEILTYAQIVKSHISQIYKI